MAARVGKKFGIKVCKSTINNHLNKILGKPIRAGSTFILTKENKQQRENFANWILENKISGKNILFTDEKIFRQHIQINPHLNRIRLSKKDREKYRKGDPEIF